MCFKIQNDIHFLLTRMGTTMQPTADFDLALKVHANEHLTQASWNTSSASGAVLSDKSLLFFVVPS